MPCRIEVRTPPCGGVQETLAVAAEPTDTVAALKKRLASMREADGWSAGEMNLILQGRFLDDAQTIVESGIGEGAFLVVTGVRARPNVSRDTDVGTFSAMPGEMPPGAPRSQDLVRA